MAIQICQSKILIINQNTVDNLFCIKTFSIQNFFKLSISYGKFIFFSNLKSVSIRNFEIIK